MTTLKKTGIKGTELLDYPLGTKFCFTPSEESFCPSIITAWECFYFKRNQNDKNINLFICPKNIGPDYGNNSLIGWLLIQDKIELYEEPKPERVYMDRYEALKAVYEEGAKVAYDDEDWLVMYKYILIYANELTSSCNPLGSALADIYSEKKWFRVEE